MDGASSSQMDKDQQSMGEGTTGLPDPHSPEVRHPKKVCTSSALPCFKKGDEDLTWGIKEYELFKKPKALGTLKLGAERKREGYEAPSVNIEFDKIKSSSQLFRDAVKKKAGHKSTSQVVAGPYRRRKILGNLAEKVHESSNESSS